MSPFWIQVNTAFWISFEYKSSWIVAVLTCRSFGFVAVLACRRFGLSPFWLSPFWICRRFDLYPCIGSGSREVCSFAILLDHLNTHTSIHLSNHAKFGHRRLSFLCFFRGAGLNCKSCY